MYSHDLSLFCGMLFQGSCLLENQLQSNVLLRVKEMVHSLDPLNQEETLGKCAKISQCLK